MTPASDAFSPLQGAFAASGIRFAVGGSWASTAYGEPRFTNDVDILAELTPENLHRFIAILPADYFVDAGEAAAAIERGRGFNVIHMPTAFKFDLFPASAFPIGTEELDRAVFLTDSGLADGPVPFVTPEDILLAKLHWFRSGGEVSEVQWRDLQGLARARGAHLDPDYLRVGSRRLGVEDLLDRVLARR